MMLALHMTHTQLDAMEDRHREAIRRYVRDVMDHTGLDATTLARRVGLAPSTLTRFLNDPTAHHTLSSRTLGKLHAYSGVALPASLGGAGIAPPPVAPTESSGHSLGGVTAPGAPAPPPGPRDLPILGQARAGMEGFFIENGVVQGYVERPWFLVGRPNSYSCHVSDESMYPVYKHGELLYVDPSRPIGKGDDVVVELKDGQAFIKRFVRRAGGNLICEQYNPSQELIYPAENVKNVHLVVAVVRART